MYSAHFILKMTDADMENTETQTWLDFSLNCKYLSDQVYKSLFSQTEETGRLLNHMINNPAKYCSSRIK